MARKWHGSYVKKARRYIAATLPAPCWRCGRILDVDDNWTVGHLVDAAVAPHLEHDPSNWSAECARCNSRAGAIAGNRRRGLTRRIPVTSRDW